MNQKQHNELLRELSSLPPHEGQLPQFSGVGLSGIRNKLNPEKYDVDYSDISQEIQRKIEFENEFYEDEDELHDAVYYPEEYQDTEITLRRTIRFEDVYEYSQPDEDLFDNRASDRSNNAFTKLRQQYGSVSRFEDFGDAEQQFNGASNIVYDSATFKGGTFNSVEFEDPRSGTESFLYGNQNSGYDEEDGLNGVSRVFVTNFLEDLTIPLNRVLVGMYEEDELRTTRQHNEVTSMLSNILRANLEGNESGESSFLTGLKFQYDLFMRHPIWNSLVAIQRYLISPAFKLIGGLLFGFSKKSSVEEKILKAIEKQTEFQMKGEVGGRGIMDRFMDRGILGTAIAAATSPLLKTLGVSRDNAQQREDARSRGDLVNSSLSGWLSDRLSKRDITTRGRNGNGDNSNSGFDFSSIVTELNQIGFNIDLLTINSNSMVESLHTIVDLMQRQVAEDEANPKLIDHSLNRDSKIVNINSLDFMQVGMLGALFIGDADISFSAKIMNSISQSFQDAMSLASHTFEGSAIDLSDLHDMSGNVRSNESNTTPSLESVLQSIGANNSSTFGNDPRNNNSKPQNIIATLSKIDEENAIPIRHDELISLIHKNMELDKIGTRNQDTVWEEERSHRDSDNGVMGDILKYTKKTAKETEKTRKQGVLRMLLGMAGSVISGIGGAIGGLASGIGTVALAVGTSAAGIIAAIWASARAGGINGLKDLITRRGGGKNKGPTAKPTKTKTPKAPSSALNKVGKVGGVLGVGLAGMEAHSIWSDDETSTTDKLNSTTEMAGGLAGGWAGFKAGAAVGGVAGAGFLGIGAIPGAIAGGIAGGIGGSLIGRGIGGAIGDGVFGETDADLAKKQLKELKGFDEYKSLSHSKRKLVDESFLNANAEDRKTIAREVMSTPQKASLLDHPLASMLGFGGNKGTDESNRNERVNTSLERVEGERPNKKLSDHPIASMFGFGLSMPNGDNSENKGVAQTRPSLTQPENLAATRVSENPTYLSAGFFGSNEDIGRSKWGVRDEPINSIGAGNSNVSGDDSNGSITSNTNRNLISLGNPNGYDFAAEEAEIRAMMAGSGLGYNMEDLKGLDTMGVIDATLEMGKGISERGMNLPRDLNSTETSNRLEQLGSDITNSIKSMSMKLSETFTTITGSAGEMDSITAIQNSKMSMDLQSSISDSTLNMSEASEAGNKFLKSIEKTLTDMLNLQKSKLNEEPAEDNSGIMNSIKSFITGD